MVFHLSHCSAPPSFSEHVTLSHGTLTGVIIALCTNRTGTACGHFDEIIFGDELMTGYVATVSFVVFPHKIIAIIFKGSSTT